MDLERKYFWFEFSADYTQEEGQWSALAILQVINGQLESVFHPCDNCEETLCGIEIGDNESELALVYLQKKWVKELYSILRDTFPKPEHNEQLLWLTICFDGCKEELDSKTRYMYEWLYDEEHKYWEKQCAEYGIELKRYDKRKEK